ncbi:MAG TPA: alpha/beta hydrolase [Candidatus Limnocylindrales bacterium]
MPASRALVASAAGRAQRDATITLADGRRLGFREIGPRDGRAVLFFHGLGTTRVICPADEQLAGDHGVRLIAIDRPGIGLSERLPGRRLLDWPADIAQLADRLALASFAIVGWSGGGPYAVACARVMPERVRAVGLVSAPAPISGVKGVDYLRRFHRAARAAGRAPWMIRLAMWNWGRPQRRDPVRFFDESFAEMCAADQEVLSEPGLRQQMIDNSFELYRQGGRGIADEALVLARRWGFAAHEVRVPVHIWHGEQDEVVPLAMAHYLAREIRGARTRFFAEEGHHLLYRRWPDILAALAHD